MFAAAGHACGYLFPAVVCGGCEKIEGEVFEAIDDVLLARLDDLEELGVEYEREIVNLSDGTQAWMYLWIGPEVLLQETAPEIKHDKKAQSVFWR